MKENFTEGQRVKLTRVVSCGRNYFKKGSFGIIVKKNPIAHDRNLGGARYQVRIGEELAFNVSSNDFERASS